MAEGAKEEDKEGGEQGGGPEGRSRTGTAGEAGRGRTVRDMAGPSPLPAQGSRGPGVRAQALDQRSQQVLVSTQAQGSGLAEMNDCCSQTGPCNSQAIFRAIQRRYTPTTSCVPVYLFACVHGCLCVCVWVSDCPRELPHVERNMREHRN